MNHDDFVQALIRAMKEDDNFEGDSAEANVFETIEQAEAKALELGGEGFHEVKIDGSTFYRPLTTAEDYEEVVAEKTYRPPSCAKNNAKKVLRWREEHPSEIRGMTRVGWTRASQLASGEPISASTVKRMASFNRHRKNAAVDPKYKDTPWKDRGYVAWLGWGGTCGINWAVKTSEAMK